MYLVFERPSYLTCSEPRYKAGMIIMQPPLLVLVSRLCLLALCAISHALPSDASIPLSISLPSAADKPSANVSLQTRNTHTVILHGRFPPFDPNTPLLTINTVDFDVVPVSRYYLTLQSSMIVHRISFWIFDFDRNGYIEGPQVTFGAMGPTTVEPLEVTLGLTMLLPQGTHPASLWIALEEAGPWRFDIPEELGSWDSVWMAAGIRGYFRVEFSDLNGSGGFQVTKEDLVARR